MKIAYVILGDINKKEYAGIKKKIFEQIDALRSINNNVILITYDNEDLVAYDEIGNKHIISSFNNKIDKKLKIIDRTFINFINNFNIDTFYIRYIQSDIFFIKLLKNIKELDKKIYLEIPTYPYDDELTKAKLIIDKIYRRKLKKYIDKVIISSDKLEKVFGIDVFYLDNCINLENIKFENHIFKKNIDEINLIGVSYIRNCIGYDRIIKGLAEYYSNNHSIKVYFNIVGEGEGLEELKELVKQKNLERYVEFHGFKSGKDLDIVFEKSDIAIGSLGDHRLGVIKKSPLKSREYCGRGIPFISSVEDLGFDEKCEFILNIEQNDNPVDINQVISFYLSMIDKNISNKMRKYAEENFNWSEKYKKLMI